MKTNSSTIGFVIGVVGIVYGAYAHHKMNKVSCKLDMAVDELSTSTPVHISKNVVDAAIDRAVNREVSVVAHKAALSASVEITANIRKEVKQEVSSNFESLSNQVSDEIAVQVSKIDQTALTNKITKRAEDIIIDKFEGSLDGILDNYNKELKNVGKIYSSIADAMTKRETPMATYFKVQ